MKTPLFTLGLLCLGSVTPVLLAQNTAPQPPVSQSQGPGAGAASGTAPGPAQSPSRTSAPDRVGITGVPRYRVGLKGPRGTTAPRATDKVGVIGDTDGNGKLDDSIGKDALSVKLPGMPVMKNPLGLTSGTPIQVRLLQPVDSGNAKNGDMVRAVLAAPLGSLKAGAPVQITVVAAAAAGRMTSRGELSLQVTGVNGEPVLSDIITAEGKEGTKILPDDAPTRGTEAIFTPDETITLPAA